MDNILIHNTRIRTTVDPLANGSRMPIPPDKLEVDLSNVESIDINVSQVPPGFIIAGITLHDSPAVRTVPGEFHRLTVACLGNSIRIPRETLDKFTSGLWFRLISAVSPDNDRYATLSIAVHRRV